MRVVMFCHSLVSDWNHGNAHFLRGIVTELLTRGHQVAVYEPADAWSRECLVADHGEGALNGFYNAYPNLHSTSYDIDSLDLDRELRGADVVLVHEWNDHGLVESVGTHHMVKGGYLLFFHDTHHRSVTQPEAMRQYRLEGYDGALVFGEVIRERYVAEGWTERAWTWHEAADVRVFRPSSTSSCEGDLVWIGNWGDDERTAELEEFLVEPVEALSLRARVYGVRYPGDARERLSKAGIDYRGWVPNYQVPEIFGRFKATIHIPRRPYVQALPGIPTIRVFEALACGIPLVCSPWEDVEGLFSPGRDYLVARDGSEMKIHLRSLLANPAAARRLAQHGLKTILERHTCSQRVDELLHVVSALREIGLSGRSRKSSVG